jgi:peptidoglycan hydrolase CwlO-like protein
MTTLAETEQTLLTNLKEKLPLFSGIDSGRIEGFLDSLLETQPLILDNGQLTKDEEILIVSGQTVFLDLSNDIVGRFELLDGTTAVTLTTHLATEKALQIVGLTDFSIQDISLTLANRKIETDADPIDFLSATIQGVIRVEDIHLPIIISLPSADQAYWLIEGDFESIHIPNLNQLAQLSGTDTLVNFLPEAVIQASNVAISDVKIAFDPVKPSLEFVFIGLELPSSLEIIPEILSLADGKITLYLAHPADEMQRSVTGTIAGNLQIGETSFYIRSELPNLSFSGSLAEGSTISLTELMRDFLFSEISLPENVADLVLSDLTIHADREDSALSLYGRSYLDWPLLPDLVTLEAVEIDLQHVADVNEGAIHGLFAVAGEKVEVSGELGAELRLRGQLSNVNLSTIFEDVAADTPLPSDLPDFRLQDVQIDIMPQSGVYAINSRARDSWDIPVGFDGVTLSGLDLNLQVTLDDGKPAIAGTASGLLQIGTSNFNVAYNFPGDFILTGDMPTISLSLLLQEFCGGDVVRDLPLPVGLLETELMDVTFTIAPQQKQLSFAAETPLGQAEIIISQGTDGNWGFNIGFVPPSSWNLATIDPALTVLNDLDFSGSTLIVSSSDDDSLALTTIDLPQGDVGVQKGFNFFASLDTGALGLKEILPGFALDSLQVSAAIGNNPQNLEISAAIEGQFQIDKSTSFGDITFRLKPSPTDFEVALLGTVTTIIDDSPLIFTGGLVVTAPPPAGGLEATMIGTWDNPFGVQNLSVSNVGLDLKMPPLSIGITGGLQIGNFEGRAAVSLNSANPSQSMLAVEFNELQLVDIFDAFCPPQVRQAIPRDLVTTILDVEFEDVLIHIVPRATSIAGVQFEQGIRLQGRMNFWRLTADGFLNIDQGAGIVVKGDVDTIVLGNIFKLTGAQGNPKASLLADLRLGKATSIDISGAVEILGMSREVTLSISDTGFFFTTSVKIFDLFEATLAVRGSEMVNGDGIMVKASMVKTTGEDKEDLFDFLSDKASAAIEAAAKEAMREIDDAQRDVNRAQADVNNLNKSITAMRRTIEDERARDSKRLRDAQNAVQGEQNKVNSLNQQIANMRNTIQRERDRDADNLRNARQTVQSAQNKVNGLNNNITSMRNTVQKERDRDTANLRQAQTSVNNAQNEVNKIQRDINSTKSRITTINNEIAAKKRWLDARAWHEKIWAGPEYAAYESAKRIEQGALYTKLGGMEAAKHTALGVLEAAKRSLRGMEQAAKTFPIDVDPRVAALITARGTATAALNAATATLRGLEKAAQTFPIDADPRMVGLFAARNTANGALAAAKLALKGIEAVIKVFPVDADPRMISLFTARDTATAGLEVAKFTLEGVKQSVKGMAEVSQFIANGAGQLLIINEAMFESSLSAAHGGDVSLAVKLTFMNEPHDLAFNFDFHDPLQSAHALADLLLHG